MKNSLILIFTLAIIPASQAFLLFDSIDGLLAFAANLLGFGSLVTAACDSVFSALNLQALKCKCTGRFGNGIEAELKCNDKSICLVPDSNSFCGAGSFELYLVRGGLLLFPDIKRVNACVAFKFNIPGLPSWDNAYNIPEFCIEALGKGKDLDLKSCTAKINGDLCNSCEICANNKDVKFNCTNLNINPLGGTGQVIPGPAPAKCIGLGGLLGGKI